MSIVATGGVVTVYPPALVDASTLDGFREVLRRARLLHARCAPQQPLVVDFLDAVVHGGAAAQALAELEQAGCAVDVLHPPPALLH